MNPLARLEELLGRRIGLLASTIGTRGLELAVDARMRDLSLSDRLAYLGRVLSQPAELDALIEELVVPETWFFRDEEPFRYLVRWAQTVWPELGRPAPIRVLSIPCSTGEEPYSVAMALIDAGFPPGRFQVDAFDLSERALQAARRGVYRRSVLPRRRPGVPRPPLRPARGGQQLRARARRARGGALPPGQPARSRPCSPSSTSTTPSSAGTCSSTLRARRARRPSTCWRAGSSRHGVLFVGHADSVDDPALRHHRRLAHLRPAAGRAGHPRHRRHRHLHPAGSPSTAARAGGQRRPAAAAPAPAPPATPVRPPPHAAAAARQPARRSRPRRPGSSWHAAEALANQGRLEEAAALCEAPTWRGRPARPPTTAGGHPPGPAARRRRRAVLPARRLPRPHPPRRPLAPGAARRQARRRPRRRQLPPPRRRLRRRQGAAVSVTLPRAPSRVLLGSTTAGTGSACAATAAVPQLPDRHPLPQLRRVQRGRPHPVRRRAPRRLPRGVGPPPGRQRRLRPPLGPLGGRVPAGAASGWPSTPASSSRRPAPAPCAASPTAAAPCSPGWSTSAGGSSCASRSTASCTSSGAGPTLDPATAPRLLVVEHDKKAWVFPADEVHGVRHFSARDLLAAPATVQRGPSPHTRGLFPWNDRKVGYVDAEKLFATLEASIA